jgi:hypothetical protein
MRRVNAQIHDGIDPAIAVERVAAVMRGGRVSSYATTYCYVSVFNDGIVVCARDHVKRCPNSDSFVVYKEARCQEVIPTPSI